jgi:hypothetical protein
VTQQPPWSPARRKITLPEYLKIVGFKFVTFPRLEFSNSLCMSELRLVFNIIYLSAKARCLFFKVIVEVSFSHVSSTANEVL